MTDVMDRRRAIRHVPDALAPVARLRLRAGRELTVVDIGAGGALVESAGRLLPGTHVDVHVITADGRVLVRSRVLRAYVSGLWSDRVAYRGALAFERQVDLGSGYPFPAAFDRATGAEGIDYPSSPTPTSSCMHNRPETTA